MTRLKKEGVMNEDARGHMPALLQGGRGNQVAAGDDDPERVGGGDGGGMGGWAQRAHERPTRLPQRLLPAQLGNVGGHLGAEGAAGPAKAVPDRGLQPLPAQRARGYCPWREDARLALVLADLRRLTDLALRTQRADGLWNCFLGDPATTPDTSGSAGLAAALALALAARHGWIDSAPARATAAHTWPALLAHVSADGRLGGVAQANRGGAPLQRADYHVLSAMGAGLPAQLDAALA